MSAATEYHDHLADRLDTDYAEAWRPEPGEKLIGEVVSLVEREGAYGAYPVVTIRRDDGTEAALHAFQTVAAEQLARARPKVGDRLGIKYIGERQGGERRYHDWRVVVDRDEAAVDWSRYAEDGTPSGDPPASDVPADTAGLHAPLEESRAAVEGENADIPF
ncbi:MAG: hypothetical protein ACRDNE_15410 [Gaiellaceae bacterium]